MYEMLLGRVPTIGAEYQYKAGQDTWIQIPGTSGISREDIRS